MDHGTATEVMRALVSTGEENNIHTMYIEYEIVTHIVAT